MDGRGQGAEEGKGVVGGGGVKLRRDTPLPYPLTFPLFLSSLATVSCCPLLFLRRGPSSVLARSG